MRRGADQYAPTARTVHLVRIAGHVVTGPDRAETLAERDARLNAWLATVSPGDVVTVRLNSTDTLTGKVYEAPDARGTSLCVNTTILRFGNGYPGPSFEPVTPDRAEGTAVLSNEEREAACEVMHDAYEKAAAGHGWETQERSRVPWADVPNANKATMRAAVDALTNHLAARAALPGTADTGAREAVLADEWVCRPCNDTHPDAGCADVGCSHNCEGWVARFLAATPDGHQHAAEES